MKKALLILLIVGFAFWGCSETSNIIAPEKNDSQNSFLKIANSNSSMLMKIQTAETIDGEDGGKIKIDFESEDGLYSAKGKIRFKKDSFEGSQPITVALSQDMAALDFGPSEIDLLKPALLTIKYKGIEFVNGATADDFDFKYIDENGIASSVEYKKIVINKKRGWIKVVKAKLTHFSRYGFTK